VTGNQDSITSKLLWIVIGVVVAGVAGIPINYLLVRPLTPKAELSIKMLGLGEIWIQNSTSLTANHVTVSVNFYNGD
jgi:hypothetical protein